MNLTADQYFDNHLDKEFWSKLSSEIKAAALSMAESDIDALLEGGFRSIYVSKAVYEQAVFLARNYARQTSGKETTGETLGPLSESFAIINANHPGISHRAQLFVDKALDAGFGGRVSIGRG